MSEILERFERMRKDWIAQYWTTSLLSMTGHALVTMTIFAIFYSLISARLDELLDVIRELLKAHPQ